jgi:hypothetical protein
MTGTGGTRRSRADQRRRMVAMIVVVFMVLGAGATVLAMLLVQ